MSEQSMFDITWARQDQWGGEWHSLNGRFLIARQLLDRDLNETAEPAAADMALDEVLHWVTHRLLERVQERQPDQEAELTQFIDQIRDHPRPLNSEMLQQLEQWMNVAAIEQPYRDRWRNTQKLFAHLRATNFDHLQLQHLGGLFDSQHQLAIAYHGLFGNGRLTQLEPDPDAPLIHVNAELMAKCATDLRLAQQAVHQRQRLQVGNGSTAVTWEGHMLFLADMMAYECVKPLKAAGLLPADTAVVTYFQQSTEIRLIPYYNIMLIGLPSWVQNLYHWPSPSFLVIPHEVGHSLFRFGVVNRPHTPRIHAVLEQELANRQIKPTDWRSRWLEELFADAFGCLIAGPASILGLQEYLATGIPAHFMEPTPDHPIAAIRPLIQTEMLRILDERGIKPYQSAPGLLDTHWQHFLTTNGGESLRTQDVPSIDFALPGQDIALNGQTIVAQVRPILELIFDLFDELFAGSDSPKQWHTWSADVARDERPVSQNLEELQKQYQQFYQHDPVFTIQPPPISSYTPSALHAKVIEIAEKIAHHQPETVISRAEWHQIYAIAGWTDEGGGDMGHN